MRIFILILVIVVIMIGCKSSTEPEDVQLPVTGDVSPVQNEEDDYVFNFAGMELVVSAKTGGRILDLKIAGTNLLTGPEVNIQNYGSTLWPSPQSSWINGWPPPATLDSEPYEVKSTDKKLSIISAVDSRFSVKFEKEIAISLADTSIQLVYRIHNPSNRTVQMAPWEVTRVVRGGFTFYPKGDDDIRYDISTADIPLQLIDGVYWLQDSNQPRGRAQKSFSDGSEGWTAFAWQNVMLIKKHEDIPSNAHAPDQGEVEIYLSGDSHYIEVETQGRFSGIAAGKSVTWTMKWYPRQISTDINVSKGSPELVSLVRSIVR
jgi:hypothetical protein